MGCVLTSLNSHHAFVNGDGLCLAKSCFKSMYSMTPWTLSSLSGAKLSLMLQTCIAPNEPEADGMHARQVFKHASAPKGSGFLLVIVLHLHIFLLHRKRHCCTADVNGKRRLADSAGRDPVALSHSQVGPKKPAKRSKAKLSFADDVEDDTDASQPFSLAASTARKYAAPLSAEH